MRFSCPELSDVLALREISLPDDLLDVPTKLKCSFGWKSVSRMIRHHHQIVEPRPMKLRVNGNEHEVAASDDTPLLWVVREELGLTGTKYGCGIAQCGACKVHVNGEDVPSCTLPASEAVGKDITTIEGLGVAELHPVQQAWIDHAVSQCGYCQPGQIMAAVAFLSTNPNPTAEDVQIALARNLCRCGTYPRIVTAVLDAAKKMRA
jgi:isoquinoline 1-oxidoreductase subunit alpha